MERPSFGERIAGATAAGGKSYAFDDARDPSEAIEHWFQESDEGLVLFVVFYTLACRWSACTGCNLPSVSATRPVAYAALVAQIDRLLSAPDVAARHHEIAKLIVSNNGSVLDEVTFPSTALMHLLVQVNLHLPALRAICLESRPEYVDLAELDFLARAMRERPQPAEIELAIGFEAFDEHVRNKVFLKGLALASFERLVEKLAPAHFRLKCYFMQKPVSGMTDSEAVADVAAGIAYLDGVSGRSGVRINMHLNPTYVARGTVLERHFRDGSYTPPLLSDVARAVLAARGTTISIFVGLNDEGLAVEGGSFLRPGEEALLAALHAFNRTQDHAALAGALGTEST